MGIDYRSPQTPSAPGRRPWVLLCLVTAAAILPASIVLCVRSLVLDYRGNAIYEQREREAFSMKGLFTRDYKGFVARETSRSGWKRGQVAIGLSAAACVVCVLALLVACQPPARRTAIILAGAHFFIAVGLLSYWVLTGIPQPWSD